MKYLGIATIKHSDGKSNVKAKFWINSDNEIKGEYTLNKMTYGCYLTTEQATELKLIKN